MPDCIKCSTDIQEYPMCNFIRGHGQFNLMNHINQLLCSTIFWMKYSKLMFTIMLVGSPIGVEISNNNDRNLYFHQQVMDPGVRDVRDPILLPA